MILMARTRVVCCGDGDIHGHDNGDDDVAS